MNTSTAVSKTARISIGIYLLINVIWNAISFYGAMYPFLHSYYPGKWIGLKKLWYIFIPSDIVFGIVTVFILAYTVLLLSGSGFVTSKVFRRLVLSSLFVASFAGFLNTFVVIYGIGAFTPSIIRAVLNLVGFLLVLVFVRESDKGKNLSQ